VSEVPERAEAHPLVQAAAHAIAGHLSVQCPGQVLRSGPDPACAGCRKAAASLAEVAAPAVLRAVAARLRSRPGVVTHFDADRLDAWAAEIEAGGSQGGDTGG
jgi:hypothetical protein